MRSVAGAVQAQSDVGASLHGGGFPSRVRTVQSYTATYMLELQYAYIAGSVRYVFRYV